MVGLLVMVLVFLALIAAGAYWISWELQNMETRPGFLKMVWTDCVGTGRGQGRHQIPETPMVAQDVGSAV